MNIDNFTKINNQQYESETHVLMKVSGFWYIAPKSEMNKEGFALKRRFYTPTQAVQSI